jgi:Histidine kinase-, DNA gyrase B-, and HSP90-like ATPase
MSASLVSLPNREVPWSYRDESIVVGKDILEVLSSAMYVNPLALYREYIQNAADAIDEARSAGILAPKEPGTVEIEIDLDKRSVRIRDNGLGISAKDFETRMTSFGASPKRGSNARGFRGVGRLSGLGYCQELLFRSRAVGEASISELRWDCRRAKTLLRSSDFDGDLAAVVAESVQVRRLHAKNCPEHFFEVEIRGVQRLRNDWLLNPTTIEAYLSQVAPLPFAPKFSFSREISALLEGHLALSNITLKLAGISDPVFRPHRDSFQTAGGPDTFHELQPIKIPAYDGGTAAVGWILHHGYKGAVPNSDLKGLRLRSGNLQVGGNSLLEDLFTETRFNSWCVGEIHIVDSRIIPNGRRDHYEQNVHYTNLINQLSPIAREISTRCRQSSIRRNSVRQFERQGDQVKRDLDIMKQGSLRAPERKVLAGQVEQTLQSMEAALAKDVLKPEASGLSPLLAKLRRDFDRASSTTRKPKVLESLSPRNRRAYENVFSLLYECSPDKAGTKVLIDRMLARLSRNLRRKS